MDPSLRFLSSWAAAAVFFAIGAAGPLRAADGGDVRDNAPVSLETYVVTATRHEVPLRESPVAISLLTRDQIERRPSASVAELVRDMPGVMVADNTIVGMQRLRIRGEDARRSLVMIDGQEISDHSTFGPPMLIDPMFIERIELVRGPLSTLYGSRASGGVVNIITREPTARTIEASASLAATTATDGHRAGFSAGGNLGEFNFRLGAAVSNDNDRRIPSGRLADTETSSQSYTARLGWKRGAHDLSLQYDNHQLSSEAPTPKGLVDGFVISRFRMEMPGRNRERVGIFYDVRDLSGPLGHVHVDAWWQRVDRHLTQEIAGVQFPITTPPTRYDFFNDDEDEINTLGANLQADFLFGERHVFVAGANVVDDTLDKQIRRTGVRMRGPSVTPEELTAISESRITTAAVFAEDTWKFARDWQLVVGARQYFVSSELSRSNDPALPPGKGDDARLVGSAALVHSVSEPITVRAAWGQGYVYPTLLHLHTGSLFGQGNLTRPNPTLRPETSSNLEGGIRFHNARFTADFTLFTSSADDYIASVRAFEVPELGWAPSENTYANLDRAETVGAELYLSARLQETGWECYAQGTWLRRKLFYPSFSTTENGMPAWSGRGGVRYQPAAKGRLRWSFDLYATAATASAKQSTRSRDFEPGWATVNFAAGLEIAGERPWWIGLEAINLGNEEYRPSTDEVVQAARHVVLGVRWRY